MIQDQDPRQASPHPALIGISELFNSKGGGPSQPIHPSWLNLATMTTTDDPAQCSTRYCFREPGRQYVIFQPPGGSFTVNLLAGHYQVEWLEVKTGRFLPQSSFQAETGPREFTPPQLGSWVAVLTSQP